MPIPLGILAVAGAGAAGGGAAYELIQTITIGTAVASTSITNIPQDYKHLQVRAVNKTDNGLNRFLRIRFNDDTASNYQYHQLVGDGTNITSGVGNSSAFTSSILVGEARTNTANSGNNFGIAVADILDYTNTSKNTTLRSLAGAEGQSVSLRSGFWNNTAAVTSLLFSMTSGNIDVGCRISLYGIK